LRFTIWSANESHLALLNGFAEAYQKTHPTITVQFDVIPPEHYTEKISNQLAGSNPPDAGWVREDSAPALIKAGVLADLAPTLKLHPTYDLADLSESALHLWQADAAL
jgi:multiple sugar transport system substrate-binding protein